MYRDLIGFLYGIFYSFHSFSRSVMELLSYDFDFGEAGSISVGAIVFGASFFTFALIALGKWILK